MNSRSRFKLPDKETPKSIFAYLHYAGFRYWTASILPALVGTVLPFWLRPKDFTFKWLAATEFLFATVLFHAGFSILHVWVRDRMTSARSKTRLLPYAGICITAACLLGVHLNSNLVLHPGVPAYILVVYGLTVLFVGVLYILPPFSFFRRLGGEIIIAEGLGMLPVLGAYLVQVGDLTRTVYLASLPLVVATGLWVWVDELASWKEDEQTGRRTLVIDFGPRISGCYGVPILSFLFYITLFFAIFSGSVSWLTLILLLFIRPVWNILLRSRNDYAYPERMLEVRKSAFTLHFVTGTILTASSLLAILM
jgi:1,4-dihydroxy-2-naphthoate octaprenyltransferase